MKKLLFVALGFVLAGVTTGGLWAGWDDKISTLATGAGSLLDADLLDAQHGTYYLNASNVNSGTLDPGYYSAYADLTAEGFLDNSGATDLLTQTQLDTRYLNYTGDSLSGNLDMDGNDLLIGSTGYPKIEGSVSGTFDVHTTAAGSAFTIDGSSDMTLAGNVTLTNGGTIASTANGDIVINANGTGKADFRDLVTIGDGTYSWTYAPTGLGCEGSAEIRGQLYTIDTSIFGNNTTTRGNVTFADASGNVRGIFYGKGGANSLELTLTGDAYGGNNLVISDYDSRGLDFGHSAGTNPSLYLHSGLLVSTNNTRWGSLSHTGTVSDGGSFVIATGAGIIDLQPATKGIRLPQNEVATPAAPLICQASSTGTVSYTDSTTDSSSAEVCICIKTNGTDYDWVRLDALGTPCTFF